MDEERSSSESTYGTLVPLPLWQLGAKAPNIAATIGILWFVDYPQGEWVFVAVLLWVCLAGIQLFALLPMLLFSLLSRARGRSANARPPSVFRPDVYPDRSLLSISEAAHRHELATLVGGLSRRVINWSVALFGAGRLAPLLGLPGLELSLALFFILGLCLVISLLLVSLVTATLAFCLSGSRCRGLWRQTLLTHMLQFVGIIRWPTTREGHSAQEESG